MQLYFDDIICEGDGRLLVDVPCPTIPVDVAIKGKMVVILAIGFDCPLPKSVNSITRFAFHINSLLINNLFKANFAFQKIIYPQLCRILVRIEGVAKGAYWDIHLLPQRKIRAKKQVRWADYSLSLPLLTKGVMADISINSSTALQM